MIRPVLLKDLNAIQALIQELAVFEQAPDEVVTTISNLERALFGSDAFCIAWVYEADDELLGMALTYPKYSTWKG